MENRRSATAKAFGQRQYSGRNDARGADDRPRHSAYNRSEDKGERANFGRRNTGSDGDGSRPKHGKRPGGPKRTERNGNVLRPSDLKTGPKRGSNEYYAVRQQKMPPRQRADDKAKGPWKRTDEVKITSDLQITDGKYRGKTLSTITGPRSKVTTRRIRDVMFRILSRRLRARRFLDLCSGPGTMGFEAISRGAMVSTFVDRSARMCTHIRKNMEMLGIKDGHGEVVEMEMAPYMKRSAAKKRMWDVVYFAPPFDSDYDEALRYFQRGSIVAPGGILLIEHHSEMFFPESIGPLRRRRVVTQGDTALSFYERKQ